MIGSVLGSYTIVDRLGEGGMGVVYAAEHALLGRRAAIKVLLPDLSRRAEVVERFFNEARAMTSIGDAGVVQVFDFGHAPDGCAYIVMELLDGESLDDRLRRTGPLPARIALRIARQIATSLAAAHARGIIHRDLKPENIFLVRDAEAMDGERPKILDFGIAKLSEDNNRSKTRTGTFLGTPLYMSPEQCRGAGEVDARSDVYALGCVLFHLVAGRPPFDGAGVGEIVASHLREPAPAPSQVLPGVPASVDAVVARCLAKSPDERFASMSELAQALAAVQARLSAGLTGDRAAPDARTVIAADLSSSPPPIPTTLGGATAAIASPPARRRGLLVGAFGLALAALGVTALVLRGGASDNAAAGADDLPPAQAPAASTPAPPPSIDAGVAPVDASPASVDAAPPPVDAASAPEPSRRPQRPTPRRPHDPARSPSSTSAPASDPYDLRMPVGGGVDAGAGR